MGVELYTVCCIMLKLDQLAGSTFMTLVARTSRRSGHTHHARNLDIPDPGDDLLNM